MEAMSRQGLRGAFSPQRARPPRAVRLHVYSFKPVHYDSAGNILRVRQEPACFSMNDIAGIYHVGVHVEGDAFEYTYGSYGAKVQEQMGPASSGVFRHEPRAPGPHCRFRFTELLGTTRMSSEDIQAMVERLARRFTKQAYNKVQNNCTDFAEAVAKELGVAPPPFYTRRACSLARLLWPAAEDPEPLRDLQVERQQAVDSRSFSEDDGDVAETEKPWAFWCF